MKKLIALFWVLLYILCSVGCGWMFEDQYNKNGVSHFLVIAIDENQPKEYVGDLDAHKIFVEKLNIDDTYFISVTAENISIKKAIDKHLVSINDWKNYAKKIEKDGDIEILKYENYEIVIAQNECIIRPST